MLRVIYILLAFSVFLDSDLLSQSKNKYSGKWLLSLGMGIDYSSSPSFTDYLKNELPIESQDTIKTFSTGVEFFGGVEYHFNKSFSAKLDYSYYLRSTRYTFSIFIFDYTITAHQPYIMFYYNNTDDKFRFKIGAGTGYHLYNLDNNVSSTNQQSYNAGGVSFRGEFIFTPKFSEKLETYISGFVFGSSSATLKNDSGNLLTGTGSGKEVNLGGYGVGARLGLSFYLN